MNIHGTMIATLLLYVAGSLAYLARSDRAGRVLLWLGIVFNLTGLILRGFFDGVWFPVLSVDGPLTLPIFIALIGLGFLRSGSRSPGLVTVMVLALCSLGVLLPAHTQALPSAKTGSLIAPAFFLTETAGVAFFIIGGFLSLASLTLRLDTEKATRRCILWGFVLFTVAQVLGAVWSFVGWSCPFSWSPRHLASACLWCLYAALLHAGFSGIPWRTTAVLTAAGLLPIPLVLYTHQTQHLLLTLAEVLR